MKQKHFRILLRNLLYLRNFEVAIRALAVAEHRVDISTSIYDRKVPEELQELAARLEADYPNVSFGITRERDDFWLPLARGLRSFRNVLRYRRREYAGATALMERAEKRMFAGFRPFFPRALVHFPWLVNGLSGFFRLLHRSLPPDSGILAELRTTRPDALLVSPIVDLQSEQVDWVVAARRLGIPSCLMVASWDNLTNKGLIQAIPDRVVVWNEFQKREAVEMHAVPADRIVITGAQLYDHWFERRPSRSYAMFCEALGLDPARPTILYCGSSIFIARNEAEFVRRWLDRLRAAEDPVLRTANVLVRPHPMHQVPFDDLDVTAYGHVAVHPKSGGMPVLEDAKADFFDALYHCAAVVGINTSALIEAAILGKRSFTVDDPTYQRTQEGTLHFRYLTEGGILKKAADFDAHLRDLAAELNATDTERAEIRDFVQRFVRPHGLDKPAAPIFVEALLSTTEIKSKPERAGALLPLRIMLVPFAAVGALATRSPRMALDFLTRVFRFGLYRIASMRRRDGVTLLARTMPVDYAKKPLSVLVTSPRESVARIRSVLQEPWSVHWLEDVVQPGDVVYDVGANVGVYALLAAKAHDLRVKVFAFEPAFANYAALCRNILHNDCEKTVIPVPLPVFERTAQTVFKYRSTDAGGAQHSLGGHGLSTKDFKQTKPVYQQPMLAVGLDDLVDRFGFEAPDHIRLDAGSAAFDVLRGAQHLLHRHSLKSLMVELEDGPASQAVVQWLSDCGYRLVQRHAQLERPENANFFFARDAAVAARFGVEDLAPQVNAAE